MTVLYNIILWLLLPAVMFYHIYRSISRGRPPALLQRFGFVDSLILKRLKDCRPIWVHAVSVGETIAVKPLLAALKHSYPGRPLLLSNMTETGRAVAIKIKDVDCCIYFPFDYSFAVYSLLKKINPCLVIIVETELWPNFLRQSRKLKIPTIIVNGRISDRSFKRYLNLKSFFVPVLKNVNAFCMQSREDAERIQAIGAPSGAVTVTRNLKFDIPSRTYNEAELDAMRSIFRIDSTLQIITAGSTHQGEEDQVLDAFSKITTKNSAVMLILVPRHPERAGEVCELLEKRRIPFKKRSLLTADSKPLLSGEVLLVDTIGELMTLYAVADVVFVGGSLVPTGGHNLLEPASLGRPVLFGMNMSNFREIAAMTIDYGAGIQIASSDELAAVCSSLLDDHERRRVMGANGHRLLAEQGGSTELNMTKIRTILKDKE